jgi:fatty-acyl-CoA synthase
MQDDFPLLLSTLYDHSVWIYPDQEVVSVGADKSVTRWTYAHLDQRIRKLATAFDTLGIEPGEAVGTFAWNNHRHHELYWATANSGRVCHTINIRLFADQIVYIVNHAKDKAIFVDPDLVPLIAPLVDQFETVQTFVIMGDQATEAIPGSIAYEDLLFDQAEHG